MKTFHFYLNGQVQGVGFRPFVFQLAKEMNMLGWVNNGPTGVEVVVSAEEEQARVFFDAIVARAPRLARITQTHVKEGPLERFDTFSIRHSEESGEPDLILTSDVALCRECRSELLDSGNRRFGYAFTTCTNCGPRFSIVERLPYDRERTAMAPFTMCADCTAEYEDPSDRRYYSQTNSCFRCGVQLSFCAANGTRLSSSSEEALDLAADALRKGRILAVKGIGGYLLMCDAANPEPVRLLRERKVRPSKPFAVMYPDMEILRRDLECPAWAEEALCSPEAPIVLLPLHPEPESGLCTAEVAPGLDQIGALLPYAPLYALLLRVLKRPLVATSGNVSHSPIVFTDEQALKDLATLADYFLMNDRRIAIPQDDSVMRFSPLSGRRILLRRSRGIAPTLILPHLSLPSTGILAMGAELKSTFTLLSRRNTYVSPYLGDLDSYDSQQHFRHTLGHMLRLLEARPEQVLVDAHPGYFATQLGRALAAEWQAPVQSIQHHLAHFAAVLAEHGLEGGQKPVLGFIWDGTGLGEDGQIWGGEVFLFQRRQFQRVAQLDYFDFILGDKMPREPRISALALAHGLPGAEAELRHRFSATEWSVYQRLLQQPSSLQTSSMGRLFDAVASLLGLMDRAGYEGEAALRLEQAAGRYFRRFGLDAVPGLELPDPGPDRLLDGRLLWSSLQEEKAKGAEVDYLAARFHRSLAEAVRRQAKHREINDLAFGGGVFQNEILVALLEHILGKDANLYFPGQLSPNDEAVSFGQLMAYLIGG